MNNRIKEKLMSARVCCPGFSNDMYALTDRVACVVENDAKPFDLVSFLVLLESLLYDSKQYNILDQVELFPQVVDMITDENYSREFRTYFRTIFGKEPQSMRKSKSSTNEYPEYVMVAVNWWANILSSDNNIFPGVNNTSLLALMNNLSKKDNAKDMTLFKEALAEAIMNKMSTSDICRLEVDYSPCKILREAGDKVGLSEFSYPFKTFMAIRVDEVVVTRNGKQEILYQIKKQEEKGQTRILKPKEKQD